MPVLTIRDLELFEGGTGYEVVDENGNVIFDSQTYYPTHPSREWAERIVRSVNILAESIEHKPLIDGTEKT